jgi:uncharacterized membrane protein (DUF4010 family)
MEIALSRYGLGKADGNVVEAGLFFKYGISLAIGILMGMEREFSTGHEGRERPAGVRTLALIGLLGCLAAHVSGLTRSLIPLAACLGILGAFLTARSLAEPGGARSGLTTGISALVGFLAGVLCFHDRLALAGALGVVATFILSLKIELHSFARNLTQEDVFATLKFALLGVVFLPILPNRSYFAPPFDVLNPFEVGFFMVLISAVEFIGYVLAKTLGASRGIGLMGILGGLVSSTAVTFGFTQRSRTDPALSARLASAILAAWTVMAMRTLIVVATLDMGVARRLWPAMAAMALAGIAYCLYLGRSRGQAAAPEKTPFANPFELWPVLRFGFLFILILTLSRAAQVWLGDAGLYLSGFAAGLMDVDAVSFSMTRMSGAAQLDPASAARAVLLAVASNSLLKGAFSMTMGSRELRKAILPGMLAMAAAACAAAWLARG